MALSVCLLTRNEEEYLTHAVRSVAEVADEVVVADTGSRDRTVEIATDLGARVFQFAWEDDFAAGRNFLLEKARGDWVLWLNADEELLPSSHAALRECMSRGDVFGYFVHIRQPVNDGAFMETADLRLFRRREDLRFVGRLQPEVPEEVVQIIEQSRQRVSSSPVVLQSASLTRERNEAKLRWMQRLLELELKDRPGQLRYLIEYGGTLLALNEPRGHEIMAEAARQIASTRNAEKPPSVKVQVLLEYLLSVPSDVSKSRLTGDELLELSLRWFPNSPALLFKCAEHCFRAGNFALARQILERLLDLGRAGSFDRSRRFDPGLVGDDALVNLAACYERLGELDRAETCYRHLRGSRHFHPQADTGLKRIAVLRKKK